MIGKFQIAASFAVIYVYAGELMPTVVRSEAMGISSFVAGIGLLLFPYINALVSVHTLYIRGRPKNGFLFHTTKSSLKNSDHNGCFSFTLGAL